MSPFYKRNLEILKKKHPRIAEKVAKVSLSDKIQVFESRSGKLTFKITANGKKISFHSAYDPIKQSKKIIADARSSGILRDTSNVAIMGLGFGYIASELISQKNDRAIPGQPVATKGTKVAIIGSVIPSISYNFKF